jgi:hypothetical protein
MLAVGCSNSRLGQPGDGGHANSPEGKLVAETTIQRSGQSQVVRLFVAANTITLQVDGRVQALENPVGLDGRAELTPIAYLDTSHLLVTVADDRITWGWVLIPTDTGFSVGLQSQVDEGISVFDNAVKVSSRKYLDGGGYKVVSTLYRFNPASGKYESGK